MSEPKVIIVNDEAVRQSQTGFTAYMDRLYKSVTNPSIEAQPLTGEPFCGCEQCHHREMYAYLFVEFVRLKNAGHIRIEE